MTKTIPFTTVLILAVLAAVGCKQAPAKKQPLPKQSEGYKIKDPAARPYYKGSPQMRAAVQAQIQALPGKTMKDKVLLMNRILSYGEPAAVLLEKSLHDGNAEVRMMSAYGLGLRQDPRALDPLARVLNDRDDAVRFEAATAMVRLGDRRGAPVLVRGLEHPDARVRTRSIGVLKSVTGETFGYSTDDDPSERNAAIARWRAWANADNARGGAKNP